MTDTVPPEPLGLAAAKANLRVTDNSEDDLIASLIVAARQYVEDYTGLVLVPRTVTETAQSLGRWIDLDSWPVTAVAEIRYPLAGVMTALAGSAWAASLKRRPVRVIPAASGWGIGSAAWNALPFATATLPIEIDVQAGYATPGDIPATVTQAMQLLIAHWYENRTAAEVGLRAAAIEVPFGVATLLQRWRLARV